MDPNGGPLEYFLAILFRIKQATHTYRTFYGEWCHAPTVYWLKSVQSHRFSGDSAPKISIGRWKYINDKWPTTKRPTQKNNRPSHSPCDNADSRATSGRSATCGSASDLFHAAVRKRKEKGIHFMTTTTKITNEGDGVCKRIGVKVLSDKLGRTPLSPLLLWFSQRKE